MKNPDSFREPEKATDVWEKLSEKYKEMTI
jgi:hypothetical protein